MAYGKGKMTDFYGHEPLTEYTIPKLPRKRVPEVIWTPYGHGFRALVGQAYVGRVYHDTVIGTTVWIAHTALPVKRGYKERQFETEEGARARIEFLWEDFWAKVHSRG